MAKTKEIENEGETELENEADLRVYELGVHLDPELPTEGVKKAYKALRDLIEAHGTIVAEGEPQMIQLAYTISRQETSGRRDFSSAYFCWIAYETSALPHADVLTAVNANKHIVRFIDLVTTKEAARHAVEIREFTTKAPEPVEEVEVPTADVELDAALQSAIIQ